MIHSKCVLVQEKVQCGDIVAYNVFVCGYCGGSVGGVGGRHRREGPATHTLPKNLLLWYFTPVLGFLIISGISFLVSSLVLVAILHQIVAQIGKIRREVELREHLHGHHFGLNGGSDCWPLIG